MMIELPIYFVNVLLSTVIAFFLLGKSKSTGFCNIVYRMLNQKKIIQYLYWIGFFVSVLTLLFPINTSTPLLGDLLAALNLFILSFLLLNEVWHTLQEKEIHSKWFSFSQKYRSQLIYICLAITVLHFLFPGVLFI